MICCPAFGFAFRAREIYDCIRSSKKSKLERDEDDMEDDDLDTDMGGKDEKSSSKLHFLGAILLVRSSAVDCRCCAFAFSMPRRGRFVIDSGCSGSSDEKNVSATPWIEKYRWSSCLTAHPTGSLLVRADRRSCRTWLHKKKSSMRCSECRQATCRRCCFTDHRVCCSCWLLC